MLQVEALAQLGGIVMIDPAEAAQQNNFFFGGVDNVRWKKPVVPGDVLVGGCVASPLSTSKDCLLFYASAWRHARASLRL